MVESLKQLRENQRGRKRIKDVGRDRAYALIPWESRGRSFDEGFESLLKGEVRNNWGDNGKFWLSSEIGKKRRGIWKN